MPQLVLHAKASIVLPGNKINQIHEKYNLWKLNEEDSERVISSEDTFETYKDCVYKSCGNKDLARKHVREVSEWIKSRFYEGFVIYWEHFSDKN